MLKIKKEELELIVTKQNEITSIMNNIGALEAKKHELLHSFAQVNGELEDVKKDLEQTYGQINIDLKTGEYTEVEKEDEQDN
jgi:peptidoglycan hydrolase CwlO-like protein